MADMTLNPQAVDHSHGHPTEAEQNENRKFGMWLYLASEVVLFTMLIAGYAIFRATQPTAVNLVKDSLGIALVTANTFILLASSYAMVMGLRAIDLGDKQGFYRWIGLTAILGTVFVGGQYYEYQELGHLNVTLDSQEFTVATTIFENVNEVEAVLTENTLNADGEVVDSSSTIYELREDTLPAVSLGMSEDELSSTELLYIVNFANEGTEDARIFEGVDVSAFEIAWDDNFIMLDESGALIEDVDAIDSALIAYNGNIADRDISLDRLAVMNANGAIVPFEDVFRGEEVELASEQYNNLNAYFQKLLADSASNYGARFYAPTAFHGAHVVVGVIWALLILWRGYRGFYDNNSIGVEMFGLYWHFVDVVWIALFTLIYLV